MKTRLLALLKIYLKRMAQSAAIAQFGNNDRIFCNANSQIGLPSKYKFCNAFNCPISGGKTFSLLLPKCNA